MVQKTHHNFLFFYCRRNIKLFIYFPFFCNNKFTNKILFFLTFISITFEMWSKNTSICTFAYKCTTSCISLGSSLSFNLLSILSKLLLKIFLTGVKRSVMIASISFSHKIFQHQLIIFPFY